MRLSDNDERLVEKLKAALVTQRQVFQRKAQMYEAVTKNFGILKKLCR